MLKRFAVENYRLFDQRVEFDLVRTHNYGFNKNLIRNGLVNKAMIVGKNGCGKTSFGFALFDIVYTLTDKGYDAHQKDSSNFLNGDSCKKFASFEYEFQFDGVRVEYMYGKAAPDIIVYEKFRVGGKDVFIRDGIDGHNDYTGLGDYGAGSLNVNIANGPLSVLRYVVNNTVQEDGSPLSRVISFVSRMLYFRSLQDNSYIGIIQGRETIEDYLIRNGKVKDFQRYLKEMADIEVDLDVVKMDGMPDMFVQNTGNKLLNFKSVASSGTRALMLFYYWLNHFDEVSFIFVDDFDAFYHFELSEAIIRQLNDLSDIQSVVTTHNTSLFDNGLLRPDCFFNLENGRMRSFAEISDRDIRAGHSLERLYRGGEFDL